MAARPEHGLEQPPGNRVIFYQQDLHGVRFGPWIAPSTKRTVW